MKSEAAEKFFREKYITKFPYLTYHFNNDNLINEILSKISFAPIFSEKINAYTDPVDLSIIINSIQGKYGDKRINIYNRKILQLGRLILYGLHEIMGHFMRRYYSYLTHGKISFYTKEDKFLITGRESGFYIEKEFLGFNPSYSSNLTISDALCLFYWNKFEDYPIKKAHTFNINKDSLKDIIDNNSDVFNFIGDDSGQIKFDDYLIFLTPINSLGISRNTCPKEDFIYLNEIFIE